MAALLVCLSLTAVSFAAEVGYVETVVLIPNGDHEIPATVCLPTGEGKFPAVVMLHGTGSHRDGAGNGFKMAAPVLAEKYGIATIRIDFMGSGDSTADYSGYTFSSAVSDAVAAANYMKTLGAVDGERIGVLGWSQGGTNALSCCARVPELFTSVVTWAGAPDLNILLTDELYAEARVNGFFNIPSERNGILKVSLEWCEDVRNVDVLAEFAAGYSGPVLALHGDMDTVVDPEWSSRIAAVNSHPDSRAQFIEGMDHTFNVFDEADFHSLYAAVDYTGAFFAKTLSEN